MSENKPEENKVQPMSAATFFKLAGIWFIFFLAVAMIVVGGVEWNANLGSAPNGYQASLPWPLPVFSVVFGVFFFFTGIVFINCI